MASTYYILIHKWVGVEYETRVKILGLFDEAHIENEKQKAQKKYRNNGVEIVTVPVKLNEWTSLSEQVITL